MSNIFNSKCVLKLDGVTYQPGNLITPIVNDINTEINSGELVVITGSASSGKTVLLKLINRLYELSKGKIYYNDRDYRELKPNELRRQINLVPQEAKLLGMTGKEAIAYPLSILKIAPEIINQKIINITSLLNIPADWLEKADYQLSKEQKHLITIARSLILEPKIILLDDPLINLDLGMANQLLNTLKKLTLENNLTVAIVTKQIDLVQPITSRLLYLQQGRLIDDRLCDHIDWTNLKQQLQTDIHQDEEEW